MFTKCFVNVYTLMFLKPKKVSDFKIVSRVGLNFKTASERNELFVTVDRGGTLTAGTDEISAASSAGDRLCAPDRSESWQLVLERPEQGQEDPEGPLRASKPLLHWSSPAASHFPWRGTNPCLLPFFFFKGTLSYDRSSL